jgi:hypothetical protein
MKKEKYEKFGMVFDDFKSFKYWFKRMYSRPHTMRFLTYFND